MLLERVGAWRVDVVLRATEDLEEFKAQQKLGSVWAEGDFVRMGVPVRWGL